MAAGGMGMSTRRLASVAEEGEFGHRIFFLLLGEVAVTKKGVPVATIKGCGEIFGEDPILNQQTRSATVRSMCMTC